MMEGGKIKDVAQVTAAMIVLGRNPRRGHGHDAPCRSCSGPRRSSARSSSTKRKPLAETIEDIIGYATQARKQGIVSLEQAGRQRSRTPSCSKALNLAVDGIEMSQIRSIMELEIALVEQHGEAEAKVFEAAGGYAPTIGIIGAVLGLIQVMKNLANIDEVGRGIAVAFVATVYGVGVGQPVLSARRRASCAPAAGRSASQGTDAGRACWPSSKG